MGAIQRVVCGLVGVAVDQRAAVLGCQPFQCRCVVHIHPVSLGGFELFTALAHAVCNVQSFCQWLCQKGLLPACLANFISEALVIHIRHTQGIAMTQQPAVIPPVQHGWVTD